jgi:hypothetical protein
MSITIINDCSDENAFGRQLARLSSYFPGEHITRVGVAADLAHRGQLEAAGNIIDILDAYEDRAGVVVVNVAPRSDDRRKRVNGSPFCYFSYKNTLILSTVDGLTLSLVKKLRLVEEIHVLNIEHVLSAVREEARLSDEDVHRITQTQFRSFEFLSKMLVWLREGIKVPSLVFPAKDIESAPYAVWYVDSFGNCKTTILGSELEGLHASLTRAEFRSLPVYERLKDVPPGIAAFVVGSSGVGQERFAEIVVQGGSAAKTLLLESGDLL